MFILLVFFSSRRRHTRWPRDWSSDVCSSDLYEICDVGVDGGDGLKKIYKHDPDLVLLDIRMPGYTGIELVRHIKQGHYKCKVIILTAYSNFSYAQELIELGIESYLLKPIDEDELRSEERRVG